MRLRDDERAQSVQIGAVLLFGTLIIAFSSYQAFVVPDQNEEVEFNHNQQVQGELQDLRNVIVSVAGGGTARSTSIQLGTRYPSRAVAANPGPPSGSLRTDGSTTFEIDNVEAKDDEIDDYWNGDPAPYDSSRLVYEPTYNLYTNAPSTVYAHTVLHNQFREGTVTKSGQVMVDGSDITIITLNGSLHRASAGATTVDVRPVSASSRTIDVTNAGDEIELTFPSALSKSEWETILETEFDPGPGDSDPGKNVTGVSESPLTGSMNEITITLEPGDYDLRMAKVGVGTQVDDEPEAYLTDVEEATDNSVAAGNVADVVLEVRDKYNNPVDDVRVYGGVDGGSTGTLTPIQPVSDTDGRVVFEYQGSETGTQRLNFSTTGLDENYNGQTAEDATVELEMTTGGSEDDDEDENDQTTSYPDEYDDIDWNYPDPEPNENNSIPPDGDGAGELSGGISGMQSANDGDATSDLVSFNRFDIGIATYDIASANNYDLVLRYNHPTYRGDVTLHIVDENGDLLQSASLQDTSHNGFTTQTIGLTGQAKQYVRNNGNLYVVYNGGSTAFVNVDFQRIEVA